MTNAGLPSGSRVYYRVGWPEYDQWSDVFDFTTFKSGGGNFPVKIGVMADLGLSVNSTRTAEEMYKAKPHIVLNIGDLPYAGERS